MVPADPFSQTLLKLVGSKRRLAPADPELRLLGGRSSRPHLFESTPAPEKRAG